MGTPTSLGIKKLEALHFYVHDLARSHRFYTEKLDFAYVAHSDEALSQRGRQRSQVYAARGCVVVCSQPLGQGGRAWRYLQRHPAGIGALVFEVEDIGHAFRLLEERGGTFVTDIERANDGHGSIAFFSITTPFGDTTFRFVERRGAQMLYPGMRNLELDLAATNRFGFVDFDHVTTNFQTMRPALLWMEHVLGFETFWKIDFHTDDVAAHGDHGSGLRSMVMFDPHSGVKFANNEPFRPFFKQSQINIFNEQHRGDGVQHVALVVDDILSAVRGMRGAGLPFMPTPGTYYDALPTRLTQMQVGHIDEDLEVLRALQILVDGEAKSQYLLQIFMKEAAGVHGDVAAGPFFYEVIQRKGDRGFGGGNFRALFESIERTQKGAGAA